MAVTGKSKPTLGGGYKNYDKNGKKTGTSRPNRHGGYNYYNNEGKKTGYSKATILGYDYYDANGKKTGHSEYVGNGELLHYDKKGKQTGTSYNTITKGVVHTDNTGGCYVATCVYGSYDCPEVWTLRRYRDYSLAKSAPGRLFIRTYYAVSPHIVRMFGDTGWFQAFWKGRLDRMVGRLNQEGYEDTPYDDVNHM